jgi:hypothetical protein
MCLSHLRHGHVARLINRTSAEHRLYIPIQKSVIQIWVPPQTSPVLEIRNKVQVLHVEEPTLCDDTSEEVHLD